MSVENVYKVFGRRPVKAVQRLTEGASRDDVKNLGTAAVIDASFEVAQGEIFVVMGLSGSGKSTLIRMLNGLWKPTAGHVRIGDDDLSTVDAKRLRALRRTRVSMVFQHFALLPHRTVLDNAAYPLEIQGMPREQRIAKATEALEMVGLGGWADSLPSQLSGGMRQRVGLARALAADTDVLLMDEAFSALDPLIRREMQEQLLELQRTLHKTIIFITHDLNEAMHLGDRIAVMRDGRIVQIGTSEEILSEPANDYVAQFVADVDRTRVLTAQSVMVPPADGTTYSATSDDSQYVEQDTPLAELFAPAAESAAPLEVHDDAGDLVGVIPRDALLEAMVPGTEPETTTEAPGSDARGAMGAPPTDEPALPGPATTKGATA
ncbi:glycine/betaine ABC transporter ATP-binding protein [Sediminihabitans luteus]|uniref:quaternary amine ABC transporter ATP-binding protein n=1 Tax=Sediminihabitans luteus TaxID=1138585 RepID=UPI001A631C6C|nr:betaine/proline/choline family ABC transporter ATP-binding protein [Sediminihabitans luteus]GII99328.1 glycine/betaine ABC transporter ATP-binding protein [Sediminihabitans luteus]